MSRLFMNMLPPEHTWRDIWNMAKDHIQPDHSLLEISARSFGLERIEYDTYRFDIDFIKARCWEEVEPNLPTRSDIDNLAENEYPSTAIYDKLIALCSQ